MLIIGYWKRSARRNSIPFSIILLSSYERRFSFPHVLEGTSVSGKNFKIFDMEWYVLCLLEGKGYRNKAFPFGTMFFEHPINSAD
jgi:hypothetical protein